MRRKKRIVKGQKRYFGSKDVRSYDSQTLGSLLQKHDESGSVPFHMPGHKRNEEYTHLHGAQKIDITEIEGFDNLNDASGILLDCEREAASYFGALHTKFLVNGSSGGVLGAIKSVTSKGDKVLVARNCHKCVFNAIELFSLEPIYVYPDYFEEYGFYGSVQPSQVEEALSKEENVKLVVITSPTYEGIISNIKEIADICHTHGALLFVDEAHGAHLGLCKKFCQSARSLGADLVVNSLHKTLPSLTQTALLHVCSDRVDMARVNANCALFQTTSPSYVLMASIDGCVKYLKQNAQEAMSRWSELVDKFRRSLSRAERIRLLDGALLKDARIFAYDKTKLVILTTGAMISGTEITKALRSHYNIELEMASRNYAIAMTGLGDKRESYLDLAKALFEINYMVKQRNGLTNIHLPQVAKKQFNPHEIDTLSCEMVDFEECEGRVCAEYIWAYPPDCPLIVKGEIIDGDFVKYIMRVYEGGVKVSSSMGAFPKGVLCVKQD